VSDFYVKGLEVYQKSIIYAGIKMYNKLPIRIKSLSIDRRQFQLASEGFLYSVKEFINLTLTADY
jgi:hypothetical protein